MTVSYLERLEDERNTKAKSYRKIVDDAVSADVAITEEQSRELEGIKSRIDELDIEIKNRRKMIEDAAALRLDGEKDEELRREQHEVNRRSFNDHKDRAPTQLESREAFAGWLLGKRASKQQRELAQRFEIFGEEQIELNRFRGVAQSGEMFDAPKSVDEALEQHRSRQATSAEVRAKALESFHARATKDKEERATNIVSNAALGGNTVPDEMMREIEIAQLRFGGMRQVSTILSTATGANLPIPTSNDVTNEGIEIPEDTLIPDQEVAFGQATLGAYKYSSRIIPVSIEFLQDSAVNMGSFLGRIIGERLGRITNRRFTTGDGTNKPRGITLDAANSGVTAASATALTFDEIMNLIHSVDPAYRLGAQLMGHDSVIKLMKVMKDSQNRPIWLPSLVVGEPDTFLGYPYVINQHMPTGSSAKGLVFGDLSKYYIRDVMPLMMSRLDERYAEYARVAFFALERVDGRLIDAGTNPVKYLTLAA